MRAHDKTFSVAGLSVRPRLAKHKKISQCLTYHQMIESIVESLIAYGLSRKREFADQAFVEEVVSQTRENDYRLRAMLKAFVNHERFKLK